MGFGVAVDSGYQVAAAWVPGYRELLSNKIVTKNPIKSRNNKITKIIKGKDEMKQDGFRNGRV